MEEVAASLLIRPPKLLAQLDPLLALGIVRVEAGVLHVAEPAAATRLALAAQAAALSRASRDISRIAEALPVLAEGRESTSSPTGRRSTATSPRRATYRP